MDYIDLSKIDFNQSIETLARWYNILNGFEWPEDLPGKPEGYDDWVIVFALRDPKRYTINSKNVYIFPLMKKIIDIIGIKETLRYHHIHNLKRTDDQFEHWYTTEFES